MDGRLRASTRAGQVVALTAVALMCAISCQSSPPRAGVPSPGIVFHGLKLSEIHDAEDWFLAMRAYPHGIPPGARQRALEDVAAKNAARRRTTMLSTTDPWSQLGPSPLYSTAFTFATSGRATAIASNPKNPAEVWLGTATGGVWHTLNAQTTDPAWQVISDLQSAGGVGPPGSIAPGSMAMSIGSLQVDGCDLSGCQRVWIGTGEDGSRRDTYWGTGLYMLPQTGPLQGVIDFRPASIVAIALARDLATGTPPMTNTLYLAVSSGVTAAGTEETVTAPAPSNYYGIWKTTDGTNFQRLPVLPPSVDGKWLPTDIQFDPHDRSDRTLLVGVASLNEASATGGGRYDPTAPRGIFRTQDGGQTWCSLNDNTAADPSIQQCQNSSGLPPSKSVYPGLPPATGPDEVLGQITLRFSPNQTSPALDRVYALVGQCGHRARFDCPSALYRSENGGTTWAQVDLSASPPRSYGRYTHAFAVVPSGGFDAYATENLLVGGKEIYLCGGAGSSGVCTVAPNSCGYCSPALTHPDHHDLVFPDQNHLGLVYDADDGGFFWGTNVLDPSAATWTSGNSTLTTNQFTGIAVVNQTILGGLQDQGLGYFAGSAVWGGRNIGDGGPVVGYSYGTPPNIHAVWLYETYQSLPFEIVDDPISGTYPTCAASNGGLSANFPQSALNECSYGPNGEIPQQCGFFNPLAVNQSTHDLYVGTVEVYKSTDTGDIRGCGWTSISPILASNPSGTMPDIETDNVLTALSVGNDGTVYAGTYLGEVWVSSAGCKDSSCAWTKVADPFATNDPLPQLAISSLLVSPTNSNQAFVTQSGFSASGHVSYTNDRGHTWFSLAGPNLVNAPANVIRFDTSGNLWLGTDVGIYELKFPLEWVGDETRTLPLMPIVDIASEQDASGTQRLYAATHGRGVWMQTDPTPTVQAFNTGSPELPVYGTAFHIAGNCATGCACTMGLMQQSGNLCAQGTTDASGGSIFTDNGGNVYTSLGQQWHGKPVVWACLGTQCVGGASATQCSQDASGNPDPLSEVVLDCGAAGHGVGRIPGPPALASPPSGSLTAFDPPPKPGSPAPPPPPSWTFDVAVSLTTPTGAQVLCQAPVTVPQTATTDQMVTAGAGALNANPACGAAGVTAVAQINPSGPAADDEPTFPSTLAVRGPSLTGSGLYVTVRGAPGSITDLCFDPAGLGDPVLHKGTLMTTQILTSPGGAAGGSIRFLEDSDIGSCSRDVPTTAGMTATQIVAAIAQAFRTVSAPGPAECLARSNPLDIQVHGASFDTVLPRRLRICSFDAGVGFGVAPNSLTVPNLPPDCSNVTAAPTRLSPPDDKFVPIALSGATDPDGDTVTISVDRVRQDESPQNGEVDAELVAGQLLLRSERDGKGDGRVYHVDFTASDGQGGTCTGDVTVCVPHDQGKLTCVDEGPIYPSGVP